MTSRPSVSKLLQEYFVFNCEDLEEVPGQHDWGQQDREPLRGKSASERISARVSEREGFPEVCIFFVFFKEFGLGLGPEG